jgi:hypothetical protein
MMKQVAMMGVIGWALASTAGEADASRYLNTELMNSRYLNSRYLNSRYLNTANLNAIDGSSTFYNPWTGATHANVYLDRSTFVSQDWTCNDWGHCWVSESRGDAFIGTWTTATLDDGTPSYTYIGNRWRDPNSRDPDAYLYLVYAWAQDQSGTWTWLPACTDENDNMVPAIPLSGSWNHTNGQRATYGGDKFTWSCTSGALGKCAASGYPNTLSYAPWRDNYYYSPDEPDWSIAVSGQRLHQTCTRMVRADYCGDGHPQTATGTDIEVVDFLLYLGDHTNTRPWMLSEALWQENGAYWLSCGRLNGYPTPTSCSRPIYNNGTAELMCFSDLSALPTPEAVDSSPQRTGFMTLPAFDLRPGQVLLGTWTVNATFHGAW